MMKKIILTAIYCCLVVCTYAQQKLSPEIEKFKVYTSTLEDKRREASGKKDYPEAIRLISEWIAQYDHASPEVKTYAKPWDPGMYYNLACYQNLHGNKSAALAAFEKSVALGYENYYDVLKDTDLQSLHDDKRFQAAVLTIRKKWDMNYILKQSAPYQNEDVTSLPTFTYQSADAQELVKLREDFKLDSVAGHGDEVSRIKNLLKWVHNSVRHDGNSSNPAIKNARDLIAVCKKENRGINCRMMSTILRDVYQAEGFKSRMVTCMPKDTSDFDCHVITVVWCKTMNKWIWMDPTFNAYVSDKKGNLLSIEEVRERLINGSDLVLNEDANWNNINKESQEHYLGYYMSKNLYWIQCAINSSWDVETAKGNNVPSAYINLYPGTFTTIKNKSAAKIYAVSNPSYFWQNP